MARATLRRCWAAASLAAVLMAGSCTGQAPTCNQCGRAECKNLAFSVISGDRVERTCCPRCGLRYMREARPRVTRLEVLSFADASTLDARQGFYVEGSDVHPCSHPPASTPPVDGRGCCLATVYDRCEPSLVAFATRTEAEAFAAEHGGFVRTWTELETAAR